MLDIVRAEQMLQGRSAPEARPERSLGQRQAHTEPKTPAGLRLNRIKHFRAVATRYNKLAVWSRYLVGWV
jgi:hypothetical protein